MSDSGRILGDCRHRAGFGNKCEACERGAMSDAEADDVIDAATEFAGLIPIEAMTNAPTAFQCWHKLRRLSNVANALSAELAAVKAERDRLQTRDRGVTAILQSLMDRPEINPSNYTHDEVCALNEAVNNACLAYSVLGDLKSPPESPND